MKTKTMLLCAALAIGPGFAALAGTEETVTFTATVPSVLELTTTSNTAGVTIDFDDYANSDAISSESQAAHELKVRSNRAWVITAKAGTENFSFAPAEAGDSRDKPASDLEVRKAGGAYQALSTVAEELATGSAGGGSASGNTFAVDYKFSSDLTLDPPGTYTLDAIYTLTAP
jgi:hypothetical protein